MWVMPSSSARCAQLPRAADKVPFYGALKKFRDYLNGLVVDYEESDYVFNDPKYTTISTEAELKEENLAFTALNDNGEAKIAAAAVVEANKKKRGRPKKVRGENGEEIPAPSRRKKDKNESLDGIDDDPNKKKRGRPKKPKEGATTPTVTKKRSSKKAPQAPSTDDINSMSSNIQSPSHNISSLPPNTNSNNTNGSNSNSFLPPMESPSANNSSSTSNNYQSGALSQNSSPPTDANHCFPQSMSIDHQVAPQPEISPHQTYQRSTSNQQLFSNTSEDMANEIVNDPIQSPVASSPSLAPSDFEPPQPAQSNSADLNPYSQPQQSTVDHHQHHSPLAQTHSPLGMYQTQSQQAMVHHQQMMHSPSYSPFSRQQQQQQNFMQSSQLHQQQPNQTQNVHNTKQQQQQQMGGQMNGVTTDLFKDVAAKSLSGLESLVDQIPNINEQDSALGALAQSTGHSQNGENDFF